MTDEEKKRWEDIKAKLLSQPWADDGSDVEWDEETTKNWEEKMES
jgi:hypothetical protein